MDWRVVARAGAKLRRRASIAEKATVVANCTRVIPRFEGVTTVSTGRGPAGGADGAWPSLASLKGLGCQLIGQRHASSERQVVKRFRTGHELEPQPSVGLRHCEEGDWLAPHTNPIVARWSWVVSGGRRNPWRVAAVYLGTDSAGRWALPCRDPAPKVPLIQTTQPLTTLQRIIHLLQR